MSRRIVCGLNDSSASRHAASIASRLARDLNSRALLVHVREGEGRLQRLSPLAPNRTRGIRRTLRLIADEHRFPPGTDLRVPVGHAASTLIAIADSEHAELLVVGAGGRSTVSPTLLGSVSSTLMREAPCPVIIVPGATLAPVDSEGMRTVVCGVAGDESDTPVLQLAADLAARLGGQLQVVHAYAGTDVQDAQAQAARVLERAAVDADVTVAPGPPADALQQVADHHNASLIVVGAGKGSVPPSTALGPVPTRLAAAGRTALVVPPEGVRLNEGSGHYELAAEAA